MNRCYAVKNKTIDFTKFKTAARNSVVSEFGLERMIRVNVVALGLVCFSLGTKKNTTLSSVFTLQHFTKKCEE